MSEQRLRDELQSAPIDDGARARALGVVRAAFLEGEPAPRAALGAHADRGRLHAGRRGRRRCRSPSPATPWRAGCATCSGSAARTPSRRSCACQGGGRLLVTAPQGAWVVSADGSRRRLGNYAGASWSPHGRSWSPGAAASCSRSSRTGACAGRSRAAGGSRRRAGRAASVTASRTSPADRCASSTATAPATTATGRPPRSRPPGGRTAARARVRRPPRPCARRRRRLRAAALALGAGRRADRARMVARRPAPAGRDSRGLAAVRRGRARARAPVRVRARPTSTWAPRGRRIAVVQTATTGRASCSLNPARASPAGALQRAGAASGAWRSRRTDGGCSCHGRMPISGGSCRSRAAAMSALWPISPASSRAAGGRGGSQTASSGAASALARCRPRGAAARRRRHSATTSYVCRCSSRSSLIWSSGGIRSCEILWSSDRM